MPNPFCNSTPWGQAQSVEKQADGIWFASTASHGGFYVATALLRTMPAHLARCSIGRNNWFEEDCAWCAVALAFPAAFPSEQAQARQTYMTWYGEQNGPLPTA